MNISELHLANVTIYNLQTINTYLHISKNHSTLLLIKNTNKQYQRINFKFKDFKLVKRKGFLMEDLFILWDIPTIYEVLTA